MKAYTNIRPKCLIRDKGDCSVVTTAVVTGIPYAQANQALSDAGRPRNKGFADAKYYKVIRQMGFTIRRIAVKSKTVRTIERELARDYGGIKAIVRVYRHVLAWDGTQIVDWSAGRQHRIMWVDLVYPVGTDPVGTSVPVPERKALKRPPIKRSGVKVYCPEANIDGKYFKSIAAAYRYYGWDLKGHQKVRKQVKLWGSAEAYVYAGHFNPYYVTFKHVE